MVKFARAISRDGARRRGYAFEQQKVARRLWFL